MEASPPATASLQRRRVARPLLLALGCLWLGYAAIFTVGQATAATRAALTWSTETEVNTAGFNIYRSEQPAGPWQLLNENGPLAAQGGSTDGAEYQYVDRGLSAGSTYYYLIEEVEFDMDTHRHTQDIVPLTIAPVNRVALALAGAGAVLGFGMIWLAFRPRGGDQ